MKAAICPNCQSSMTRTSVGNFCLSCGTSEHNQQVKFDASPYEQNSQSKPMDVYIKTEKTDKSSRISGFVKPKVDHKAGVVELSKTTKAWHSKKVNSKKPTSANAISSAVVVVGLIILVGFITYVSSAASNQTSKSPSTSANLSATNQIVSIDNSAIERDNKRKADLAEIATALYVYHTQHGNYPTGATTALSALLLSSPPFIQSIPADPLYEIDPQNFSYQYSSNGSSYTLSTHLENTNDVSAKDGLYSITN